MARIPGFLARFLLVAAAASAVGCAPPARFDVGRAAEHVRILAEHIGSRPGGSDANRRARDYIVEQARRGGFDVRVQEADGMRPLYGASARVRNIIATRGGRRPYAIALVTHYDSVPDGPGAADAALGVAVCLEAGRVLAQRPSPNYALALVFTDGEEFGLMGASALLKDPIVGWMRAVLNFESIGAAGPALLFETAPDSGTLVDAWRRAAWRPAGSGFMTEIYGRIRADTDLTLLKRARLAGVNFAPAADSYAYHTPQDSVRRLDPFTLAQMGENAVATAEALDAMDLSSRRQTPASFFDVARVGAVAYGGRAALALLAAALLIGLFGWIQAATVSRDVAGWPRTALTALWAVVAAAVSAIAMLGAAWLLRATRESYQPWYAHPARFYLFEVLAGAFGAWLVVHAGRWLPDRLRGSLHPAAAWVVILPLWLALAVLAQLFAPPAAFLAVLPLLVASSAIAVFSLRGWAAVVVATLTLAAAAVLWLPDALLMLQFVVALFGRAPLVTPLVVYPVLTIACGLFVVPPLVTLLEAAAASWRRPRVSRLGFTPGRALTLALVLAGAWCWLSPAYTDERPLQKTVRYINDVAAGRSYWEVGSNEPGIDVGRAAPLSGGWRPVSRFTIGTPLDLLDWPFAYRAPSSIAEPPPLAVSGRIDCGPASCTAEIRALPSIDGLVVLFTLPPGIVPDETSLAGIVEGGEYRAIFAAVPREGISWRLRVAREQASGLSRARVVAVSNGLPGAPWPSLPAWLPAAHLAWRARSYFSVPVAFEGGAPRSERGTIN